LEGFVNELGRLVTALKSEQKKKTDTWKSIKRKIKRKLIGSYRGKKLKNVSKMQQSSFFSFLSSTQKQQQQ
jgi:hypothetical protein